MSAATPREATALVALAHGSRDPRAAATTRGLVEQVRCRRPGLRAEPAFLDLSEPTLDDVVDRLVRAGARDVVVVPLLLTEAYHARVDVPAAVSRVADRHPSMRLRRAGVLGTDDTLLRLLDDRLAAALAGPAPGGVASSGPAALGRASAGPAASGPGALAPDALVLAAAGSSDAKANDRVAALARRWGLRHGLPARAAFASAARPDPAEAVLQLRAESHARVAVGQLFLAPGLLPDRAARGAREAGAQVVAGPLGADPVIADLVLERFDAVAGEVAA